jgi:hypothetical protein
MEVCTRGAGSDEVYGFYLVPQKNPDSRACKVTNTQPWIDNEENDSEDDHGQDAYISLLCRRITVRSVCICFFLGDYSLGERCHNGNMFFGGLGERPGAQGIKSVSGMNRLFHQSSLVALSFIHLCTYIIGIMFPSVPPTHTYDPYVRFIHAVLSHTYASYSTRSPTG